MSWCWCCCCCCCTVAQDPNNLEAYLQNNIFLPDINNEREDKDSTYADNLASLTRLVLYRFEEDTTGETRVLTAAARCHYVVNVMLDSGSVWYLEEGCVLPNRTGMSLALLEPAPAPHCRPHTTGLEFKHATLRFGQKSGQVHKSDCRLLCCAVRDAAVQLFLVTLHGSVSGMARRWCLCLTRTSSSRTGEPHS
jgi:hypothetical protein